MWTHLGEGCCLGPSHQPATAAAAAAAGVELLWVGVAYPGKWRQKGRTRELWAASQETWAKPDPEDEELLEQVVKSQHEFFHLCHGAGLSAYFLHGVGVRTR